MCSSDHLLAMLRMTANASSGVRQPCSPVRGLTTLTCECCPPRQWIVTLGDDEAFNAGNRTAETVKDTAGALRRQLARSIDALGRVQQTTGGE